MGGSNPKPLLTLCSDNHGVHARGIPVLDVRPKGWRENGKVVVYTHGGAHVMYSAESTLGRAVIFASDTGHRVIPFDYTVAPEANSTRLRSRS